MSDRGERGPRGDHGQTGDTGERGPRGLAYSSWIIRHVTVVFFLLLGGIVLAFVFADIKADDAIARIETKARVDCEAGNKRSQGQVNTVLDRLIDSEQFTEEIARALDRTPDEVRRLSRDRASKDVAEIPFVNCQTGLPLPPATIPATLTTRDPLMTTTVP